MSQTTTLITEILAYLLGRKYYANVINAVGTTRCELSCFIFRSRAEAEDHRISLADNHSYRYIQTVTFRSRRQYSASR